MAPWNIQQDTWLKFLVESWEHHESTLEGLPVPAANTAYDGLCDPLSAEKSQEWIENTMFQIVALPAGAKERKEGKKENRVLLAHNLALQKVVKAGEPSSVILFLKGLGSSAQGLILDLPNLSRKMKDSVMISGEEEERGRFENVRIPSLKQFLEAQLDEEELRGLKGNKRNSYVPTVKELLEKGSSVSISPYVLKRTLELFHGEDEELPKRLEAVKLLVGMCEMVQRQYGAKTITQKKAADLYHHHLAFFWLTSQPNVSFVVDPAPYYPYKDGTFEKDNIHEGLNELNEMRNEWWNKKSEENHSEPTPEQTKDRSESPLNEPDERATKTPKSKAKDEDNLKNDHPGAEDESLSDGTPEGDRKPPAVRSKAKKRKTRNDSSDEFSEESSGMENNASSSEEEQELVDYDKMFAEHLALIEDPVKKLELTIQREDLKIRQASIRDSKKSRKIARQQREYTRRQSKHLKSQSSSMNKMRKNQEKEAERQVAEKSVLKKWSEENKLLLKRLSSVDFQEKGEPKPTKFAREAFSTTSNFGNSIRRFEAESARWNFRMLPSGFAQVMAGGFYNANPVADPFIGLTSLMFCPDDCLDDMGLKEGRKRLL